MPGRYARNSSKKISADTTDADFAAWELELDIDEDSILAEFASRDLALA